MNYNQSEPIQYADWATQIRARREEKISKLKAQGKQLYPRIVDPNDAYTKDYEANANVRRQQQMSKKRIERMEQMMEQIKQIKREIRISRFAIIRCVILVLLFLVLIGLNESKVIKVSKPVQITINVLSSVFATAALYGVFTANLGTEDLKNELRNLEQSDLKKHIPN